MSRLARTVAVGCAHHITQRGNNRQDVFFVNDDRRVYLELPAEQDGPRCPTGWLALKAKSQGELGVIQKPWKVGFFSWRSAGRHTSFVTTPPGSDARRAR